jgi:CBS domain-containing protein
MSVHNPDAPRAPRAYGEAMTTTAAYPMGTAAPDAPNAETVREVMTPGVVTIAEDASLTQVCRAISAHGVHAILVVGRDAGTPLGWVTARGLLGWLGRDHAFSSAREAVTEEAVTIEPSASVREALVALSQPGTSHLLVAHASHLLPEGVVSDIDLVRAAVR